MSEARQSPRILREDPCRRLWSLWQEGQRPDLAQFLSGLGPLQPTQLAALLRVDQRQRWQSGERIPAEFYLENYSALQAEAESALEIVYAEFLLREELGESPRLAEYQERFPQYGERLRDQIDLHQALGSESIDKDTPADSRMDRSMRPTLAPASRRAERSPWPSIPGYEITAEVGRGGMGVVYRASQASLKRVVALKMVLAGDFAGEQDLIRFRAEAEAAARLHHPNIVQIYEIGEHDGRPYFTMEYVDGGTLARLANGIPQPVREAAELVATLSRAMHYAHQKGIVHRDLKPANILFAGDSAPASDSGSNIGSSPSGPSISVPALPKITDFGLAKFLVGGSGQTESGAVLGTPSYMAPEQAAGKVREAGPPVDVYALGAILYELLTGRPPFGGASPVETLQQIQFLEPVSPRKLRPKLARDLETICLKCLDKDARRRYQTAQDLADDLQRFLAGEPIHAHPAGRAERVLKWARRRPALAALAAVSLAAILFAGRWAWFAYRDFQRQATAIHSIQKAVEKAVHLRDQARASSEDNVVAWTEALEAARLAHAIASQGYSTRELDERIRELEEELQAEVNDHRMAERLDEIRLRRADMEGDVFDYGRAGGAINYERTEAEYTVAFKEYGISIDQADPERTGAAIRDRKINDKLLAALDDWIYVRTMLPASMKKDSDRLVAIARAADSDPWRNRLRECMAGKDGPGLKKLAAVANDSHLPASTFVLLGNALANTEGAATAANVLQRAIQHHAADFWVNYYLGRWLALKESPDLDGAIRYYTAARAIRSQSAVVHYGLGNVLRRKKKWDEAIGEFHEAIRLNKSFALSYRSLGLTLQQAGKPDEALAATKEALRLRPDDPDAYLILGLAYYDKKDFPGAADANRKAIQLKKDFAIAYNNLGNALNGQKKPDEAVLAYRQAIALKKDYALAHYNLATVLRATGKLDEAIAECREAIRLQDNYANAHTCLANALTAQGHVEEAITEYRKAIQLEDNHADAFYGLGIALRRNGRLDEAIANFERTIQIDKKNYPAHDNLGLALLDKGNADRAVAEFREALACKVDYEPGYYGLGLALRRKGNLGDALAACREAIRLNPNHAAAHNLLGNLLNDQKKFDEAATAYRAAIALKRNDEVTHRNLGLVLRAQGKLDEAIGEYREAIRLKEDYADAHTSLGYALLSKPSPDEAIKEFRKVVDLRKDNPSAINDLGVALYRKRLTDQAIAQYREAIRLKSDFPDAHNNLGLALQAKGHYDQAVAEFREANRLKKDYLEAHNNLAWLVATCPDDRIRNGREALELARKACHLTSQHNAQYLDTLATACAEAADFAEAVRWEEQALALPEYQSKRGDPARARLKLYKQKKPFRMADQRASAHVTLGNALLDQGNVDQAITEYHKAILQEGNHAEAFDGLGVALRRQGRLDEAIANFERAIQIDKKNCRAHDNLGLALLDRGTVASAIAEFHEAILCNPDYAPAYYGLALAHQRQRNFEDALVACRQAVRLNPNDPATHNLLGNVFYDQKNFDEAAAAYRAAIAANNNHHAAHRNLGLVLQAQGKLDEAIAEYREAIRIKEDFTDARLSLAGALLNKQNLDEAIKEYRKFIALEKDNASAVNGLGIALYRKGLTDEAIVEYKNALRLKSDFSEAHNNLGLALRAKGKLEEAITEYDEAIRLKKDNATAYGNRALAFLQKKTFGKAAADLDAELHLLPTSAFIHNQLAWLLATCPDEKLRNGKRAVELAGKACELTSHRNSAYLDTLAAACAETGDFAEAVRWEEQALALPEFKNKKGDPARARLELYKQKKPFHQQ